MAEKTKQEKKQGMDRLKKGDFLNLIYYIKKKKSPKIEIRLQKDISKDTLETFLLRIG